MNIKKSLWGFLVSCIFPSAWCNSSRAFWISNTFVDIVYDFRLAIVFYDYQFLSMIKMSIFYVKFFGSSSSSNIRLNVKVFREYWWWIDSISNESFYIFKVKETSTIFLFEHLPLFCAFKTRFFLVMDYDDNNYLENTKFEFEHSHKTRQDYGSNY